MLTTQSFKKSLIVEQFQGNYLKVNSVIKGTVIKTMTLKNYTFFETLTRHLYVIDQYCVIKRIKLIIRLPARPTDITKSRLAIMPLRNEDSDQL